MTNIHIERLGMALTDDLIMRFRSAANLFPVVSAHDSSGDLYLTVTDAPGSSAIVKFETQSVASSGQFDSLGLAQPVYTPHVTKLGIDAGAAGVKASDTVTLTSAVATKTVTINGSVFTAVAGAAANATQFTVAGTDAQDAAALANAINTSVDPLIAGVVTAVAVGNAVTITAVIASVSSNNITVASNDASMVVATATLTGGTNSTVAGTSDKLRNTLIAEVAPTGTALIIYEKAGILESDLVDSSLVNTCIRNLPWGMLAQA
jgi:hypothetical protein